MGLNPIPERPPDWRPQGKDSMKLYSLGEDCGWKRKDVHKLLEVKFGKTTSKDLTSQEYDDVIAWVQLFRPEGKTQ